MHTNTTRRQLTTMTGSAALASLVIGTNQMRIPDDGPNRPWGQGDTPLVEVLRCVQFIRDALA